MKTESTAAIAPPTARSASRKTPFLERLVRSKLEGLAEGTLEVVQDGMVERYGNGDDSLHATIEVRDPRFWSALARRGTIGGGEAYAEGHWTSDDPAAVVRLFTRNRAAMTQMEGGLARLSRPLFALGHALRRNTLRGSRENIGAHYDLSNEFFSLFLDDTMTYSCGIFTDENTSMKDASIAKIDHLCRKLDLSPSDHLLEIGTGWGALARHAAQEYGCRVTTTTISREQHDLAAQRFRDAELEDRVTLLFEDYRRLEGQFDKLVSVEMIEAVGHRYYDTFFRRCAELLKPDGVMALQAITIADQHYESAKHSVDFIQKHIFPGSCIPSVTALCSSMTRASDLRVTDIEDIGLHYVPTLATWRRNLRERWDDAKALGYSEDFLRLWEFYFCYCEGGFAERHISDVHMMLAKPRSVESPILRA